MEKLASVEHNRLDDVVEIDELYTHAGMKGRSYQELLIKDRMPRSREIKSWRGRNTFDKDTPMIMCYHERNDNTVFDVPLNYNSVSGLVCKAVSYASAVYADEYVASRYSIGAETITWFLFRCCDMHLSWHQSVRL